RLGSAGFFATDHSEKDVMLKRIAVVEEIAKVCMTTAFCVWCHFAATTYVSHSENNYLRERILPQLLNAKLLAGTGLSNPLKSFANLEKIHLQAKKVSGGYIINGALPAVSNIGAEQSFAFIAEVTQGVQI